MSNEYSYTLANHLKQASLSEEKADFNAKLSHIYTYNERNYQIKNIFTNNAWLCPNQSCPSLSANLSDISNTLI